MKNFNKCRNLLAGLVAATVIGTSPLAYAKNEITVDAGTKDSPLTIENRGIIESEKYFDYVKYNPAIKENLCLSLYGVAALVKDTGKYATPTSQAAGAYIDFTNDGVINMHYKDTVKKFAEDFNRVGDENRKYNLVMGWPVFAGKNSRLVNNGDINIFYDQEDSQANYKLLVHAMHAGDYSSVINNGNINITGAGSTGTEAHALTSESSFTEVENNGSIVIDVKNSYMTRAFLTVGKESSVINNGTIFNRSNCVVFSMLGGISTKVINNGTVTTISAGHISGKVPDKTPDFMATASGAYGMTYSPKPLKGTNCLINRGKVISKVQADKSSRPDAIAAGMLIMNASNDPSLVTLENTGIIEVSSNIKPNKNNNYLVRATEISINSLVSTWKNTNVAISTWATNLRDFGKKKDFIQARNCSIDFSDAKLILREGKNYKRGTVYKISPETLIAPLDGKTLADSNIVVKNFGAITFSAEDTNLKVLAVKNSDGSFNVSLREK